MKFAFAALLIVATQAINVRSPTGAEMKVIEDEKEVMDWGSGTGNNHQSSGGKTPLHLAQNASSNATANATKAWPQEDSAGPTNSCVNPVEIEHPPTADGRVGGPPCVV